MILLTDTDVMDLLAECFRHPHEIHRYGVLADWLEERGRPFAHICREAADGVKSRPDGRDRWYSPLRGRYGPKSMPFGRRTRERAEIDMAYHVVKALGCRTCRRCCGSGFAFDHRGFRTRSKDACRSCAGRGIKSRANDLREKRQRAKENL